MSQVRAVVGAAAPVAVGQEVELLVVTNGDVLVRDLSTQVLYGRGSHLEECEDGHVTYGPNDDFRHPRLSPRLRLEKTIRGRVVSCVVANVRQSSGEHEMATSLVVEVDTATGPYR